MATIHSDLHRARPRARRPARSTASPAPARSRRVGRQVPERAASRRGARRSRPSGSPGSNVDRPPVSRPPIAFGWPVSDSGPVPARPMLPGRQAEVDQRAVLERPDRRLVDAHRPQRHRALGRAEAARGGDDVLAPAPRTTSAARSGVQSAATVSASSAPRVWRSRNVGRAGRRARARAASRSAAAGRCRGGPAGAGRRARRSACGAGRRRSGTRRAGAADPVPDDRVAGGGVGADAGSSSRPASMSA